MLAKTYTAALQSIKARIVTIEVNAKPTTYYFQIVGLPDASVRESHERILSAAEYSGLRFPDNAIVVNMSPGDLRKEGTAYDLPIAIGVLAASETISSDKLERYLFIGELSLDGMLKPVRGVLPIAIAARQAGFEGLILPRENAREAAVVDQLEVRAADSLRSVVDFLEDKAELPIVTVDTRREFAERQNDCSLDFADVKGQANVKRAMEVAAAGGHNILMIGSPGSGKSMMAKRMPGILPPLSLGESLETTMVHSVAGKLGVDTTLLTERPFRSPHHSISPVALVGGGSNPMPGEISLAHNGVLFLDELAEFNRAVLEVMRQPLEDQTITISRARYSVDYPARFMLVTAMNPCPCGYYNHPTRSCTCPPYAVQKYLGRVSGPLLDRVDIQVEITPVPFESISSRERGESSAAIRERVVKAREIQQQRYANERRIYSNAQMTPKLMREYVDLDEKSLARLKKAMDKFSLSARAYDRILRVARTIADLESSVSVRAHHIAEAIGYRSLDRSSWGESF